MRRPLAIVVAALALAGAATAASRPPANPLPQLGKPDAGSYRLIAGRRFYCRLWLLPQGVLSFCQPVAAPSKPTPKKRGPAA